jgi:hypothetical protein
MSDKELDEQFFFMFRAKSIFFFLRIKRSFITQQGLQDDHSQKSEECHQVVGLTKIQFDD